MSNNKVAIVTGGTRGIGLGIATELASKGFDLAINGRRPESDVAEVLAQLSAQGGQVIYLSGDLADGEFRKSLVEKVQAHFGRLDLLVNNAGIAPPVRADIIDANEDSYDLVMDVNLKAPYFLTQLVAHEFRKQFAADPNFRGCVINIGSISAEVASTNRGDYCLSRAATSMATKLWAVRLAEFNSTAYEVRPGIVATDMTAGVQDKYDAMIADGLLVEPRWGQPADIGRAVALLASGELSYAPGQVLTIDGGLTLRRL